MRNLRPNILRKSHLLVRVDRVTCTNCYKSEPIHPGNGTPMDTLIFAYELMAIRHKDCVAQKAGEKP